MRVFLLALALVGCTEQFPATPTDAGSGPKPRVLVVTHTAGFRHASIPLAEQTIGELGASTGSFEVTYARTADDVKNMLTPAALEPYAGVVFANTTGDLGITDVRAFVAWIESGRGFVGIHSATDTYKNDAAYVDMIGAAFKQHGAICEVEPKIEDAAHPAVAHLAPAFKISDEIYEWRDNPRPRVHVLFALAAHPPDGHPEAGQPGDYPLSWTRARGQGRVFYTALGHGDETWKDERFRRHVAEGIRWSVKAP